MNREQIIQMAREAGIKGAAIGWNAWTADLERFAALVAAAEREACAKVVEAYPDDEWMYTAKEDCADAIRARGQA